MHYWIIKEERQIKKTRRWREEERVRGREGGKGRGRGRDAERKEGGGEMQRGRREGKERVHTLPWELG